MKKLKTKIENFRIGSASHLCCLLYKLIPVSVNHKSEIINHKSSLLTTILLCSILFGLSTHEAFAQSPQEQFKMANELYRQQQYQQAAELYEQILALDLVSPEAFYNLANCYYKLDRNGAAILNYERALKIEPDHEDAQFNLKLANLRVADRIEPLPQMLLVRLFKEFLLRNSSDTWGYIALLFIWLSLISGAAFLFLKKEGLKRIFFLTGAVFIFLSLSFLAFAFYQSGFEKSHRYGIVMETNTYIKSAPDSKATDLFILREGVKAELLETSGEWQKIKLADGKIGWIQKGHFEVI